MDAKELCAIIKACKNSGVTDFKMGDIVIGFAKVDETWPTYSQAKSIKPIGEHEIPQMTQDPDEYHYQLALENPVEWERQQLEGNQDGSN